MAVLHHYPLSPSSRFIRLQCSEYRFDITLRTQVPWLRDDAFLALNPAGEVPVLEEFLRTKVWGLFVERE